MTDLIYAETAADFPSKEKLLSISGLEFMRQVLAGELAAPLIGRTLNFRLHRVDAGEVVFRGTPGFEATNPMGGVHGGWYGTILDSALACAAMTTVPQGYWYTTLEYKVNITRALPVGMAAECIGRVQHAGRSTVVSAAEIRGLDDGRLYATGTTTCIVMKG